MTAVTISSATSSSARSSRRCARIAATAAGSGREAYARQGTGEKLSAAEYFAYVGEDDLSRRDVEMYGEKVARSVYCALRTKESRFLYKFRLNGSGQVLDFESTEL